jgi:hypothetical protein
VNPEAPEDEAWQERPRSRVRDFWQLDVPLVLALILCTTFTVVEVIRASEGVWRAWVYMVEWPLIGAFCVWIWYRFKHEKGGGFVRRWKARVARYSTPAEDQPASAGESVTEPENSSDPELAAWRDYQRKVRQENPPVT